MVFKNSPFVPKAYAASGTSEHIYICAPECYADQASNAVICPDLTPDELTKLAHKDQYTGFECNSNSQRWYLNSKFKKCSGVFSGGQANPWFDKGAASRDTYTLVNGGSCNYSCSGTNAGVKTCGPYMTDYSNSRFSFSYQYYDYNTNKDWNCALSEYWNLVDGDLGKWPILSCSVSSYEEECPDGQHWDDENWECVDDTPQPQVCTPKSCPAGQHFVGGEVCDCVNDPTTGTDPTPTPTPDPEPDPDPEPEVQECSDNEYYDEVQGQCVVSPKTLPIRNLCGEFEARINTKGKLTRSTDKITEFCKGDSISDADTDFSNKKPDLILSNGMRIFNISQGYLEIPALKNSTGGETLVVGSGEDAKAINTRTHGYIVYVDIDGKQNSDNILWYDVFPFYLTLDGKVIAAYKDDMGATDGFYIQTSIYEQLNSKWLAKSVSFKEGACQAGYVNENSDYCKNGTAYDTLPACTASNLSCTLRIVRPSIFMGK